MGRLIRPDTVLWLLIFFGGLAIFVGMFVLQDAGTTLAGGSGLFGGLVKKWQQYREQRTGEVAG